jgi:glyoxylase-like metal-dependent hydrolase (beta-lactamase superfamily II)
VRRFQITRVIHDGERINLGGRELEVLFTPGHAPDALCLLDRPNRLLWTGDSFYPGPIYLFVPETDFAAYTASATRLAALAQQVDLLLPSHNLPAADPENLTRLAQAVRAVQEGTTKPVEAEGRVEYTFQGFSLLLSPEAARQARARK